MYLSAEWEGQIGQYLAQGHGEQTKYCTARFVRHDREPNIFISGLT